MKLKAKIALVILFLLFLLLIRMVNHVERAEFPPDRFQVIRVLDGDTVELSGGDKLRLIGIDTPERGEPFYDSARVYLEHQILGKSVDIRHSKQRRDHYGRLLGYVYYDSVFINRLLVRSGLANVYPHKDNQGDLEQMHSLFASQDSAITDKSGIWSLEHPAEDFYIATPHGLRFHRPSCTYLNKDRMDDYIHFESRLEAFKKGYSPCRKCKP
jgi:micrococcal nuclease